MNKNQWWKVLTQSRLVFPTSEDYVVKAPVVASMVVLGIAYGLYQRSWFLIGLVALLFVENFVVLPLVIIRRSKALTKPPRYPGGGGSGASAGAPVLPTPPYRSGGNARSTTDETYYDKR